MRINEMFKWLKESEEDKKLLEDIVRHYKPSMRVVGDIGGWCLTMDAIEGRRTARTKDEDDDKE